MEKIYIPYEIFQKLPVEEADKLQDELMAIYYKNNPDAQRTNIELADGDQDLIDVYNEEEFKKIMTRDYAYDVDILRSRRNDELATRLVEAVNEYNLNLQRAGQEGGPVGITHEEF